MGDLGSTFGTLLGLVADLWRFLDALWELFGSTLGVLGVALGRLGDVFGLLWEPDGATLMVLGDTTERLGSCLATSGPHYENIEKNTSVVDGF